MARVAVFDTKPFDRDYLSAAGKDDVQWRYHRIRLNAENASLAQDCQAVCIFVNDQADRRCLQELARLKVGLVALRCAGFNNVDLNAARDLKICVTRVPAYSPHSVAEFTVALLLTLTRKIHRAYNRVREQNFSLAGLVGFDIHQKTVGIVGTGKIGRIAAQIFRGFDAEVVAYDPMPGQDWAAQHQVSYVGLEELLSRSDVVSLHLPLTPETHHLLNGKTLAGLKRGAFLINTSRGKLVETKALIAGLKEGRIGGVALDVYEEEEGVFFEDLSGEVLQDDELTRLLTFPNALVTSHQAFLTSEALGEISRVTAENIRRWSNGLPLMQGTVLEFGQAAETAPPTQRQLVAAR